ncbi:MAG: tetratricopeptide repeat protein, partial [Deltaproteobacteria bacterium]|nr:tetratricopeptide repeat protein [Deltaproteobacteria bacterium]
MAKVKKKSLKRFWLLVALVILAALIAAGIFVWMERARKNALLERIPAPEDLSFSNRTLEEKMDRAFHDVQKALEENDPNSRFGRKAGQLGNLYQANHFYDQAVPCYRVAMDFDPDNPKWPYSVAFIHQEKGETAAVQDLLQQTISLSPGYAPAILKLADNYFKSGEARKAKDQYGRRLDLQPDDPYALLGLARIAIDASQWKEGESYLNHAVKKNPTFGAAHRLLATVHDHFGRKDEMQQSLDRAAQCTRFRPAPDPWIDSLNDLCFDVEQLLVLGSKAVTELDIENASRFFNRAGELDARDPRVQLSLGRLCFMTSQLKESRAFFQKAIELDPKSDEAYFQLGVISRREGNLADAKEMFEKALTFHPENANVYNNLGVTLLEMGDFKGAEKALQKALEIYPEHINARYNLGLALWSLGKTEKAIGEYRSIMKVKPNWAIVANSLAWVLATDQNPKNRNGVEAIKWAKVACRGEGRNNPEFLDTLAAAYAAAGRFGDAVETAKAALDLAVKQSDMALVRELKERLSLYRRGTPFTSLHFGQNV